jgi:hypothetical protein
MPGSWSKSLASRPLQDKHSRLRARKGECCVRAVLHSACVCVQDNERACVRGIHWSFSAKPQWHRKPICLALSVPPGGNPGQSRAWRAGTSTGAHDCQRARSQPRCAVRSQLSARSSPAQTRRPLLYCLPWPASTQWQQACLGSCARAGQLPAEYRRSRSPNHTPRRAPSRHQRPRPA